MAMWKSWRTQTSGTCSFLFRNLSGFRCTQYYLNVSITGAKECSQSSENFPGAHRILLSSLQPLALWDHSTSWPFVLGLFPKQGLPTTRPGVCTGLNHAISSDRFLCAEWGSMLQTTWPLALIQPSRASSFPPYHVRTSSFNSDLYLTFCLHLYPQRTISATMKTLRHSPLFIRIRSELCGLPAPSATASGGCTEPHTPKTCSASPHLCPSLLWGPWCTSSSSLGCPSLSPFCFFPHFQPLQGREVRPQNSSPGPMRPVPVSTEARH